MVHAREVSCVMRGPERSGVFVEVDEIAAISESGGGLSHWTPAPCDCRFRPQSLICLHSTAVDVTKKESFLFDM